MEFFLLKVSKSLKFLKRNKSSVSLILLGLLIFSFGAFNYHRVRVLSFAQTPETITKVGENPTQIIIPSIKIDLPIDEGGIKDGVWEISYQNSTHLTTSANPGSNGNIVIYGHNKRTIFGNLPYLKVGESISLKTTDGKIHQYKVVEKLWVSPDRIDLVSPKDTEELTIYTCWGLFDNQRVVIKAIPIN